MMGELSVKKRWLVLENGKIFEGAAFGAESAGQCAGEVVFSTNMAGFTETVTDPAYAGQIVAQTFPLIGNCGICPADYESAKPLLAGYIAKEWCQTPSHFTCTGTLDAFLQQHGIPGLCGIDTRALTKLLRSEGAMRGAITDDPASVSFEGREIGTAGVTEPMNYPAENAQYKVLVWDFGVKNSVIRKLNALGCDVKIVPAGYAAVFDCLDVDGVFLPDGPGDPRKYETIIDEMHGPMAVGKPIFAVGLGHQLLALANGGGIVKLHYGHRGSYSVRDAASGKTVITSQNHGYAVDMDKLPQGATASFTNVNDGTCEGLDYANPNMFSVQFEPTPEQYQRFVASMKGGA